MNGTKSLTKSMQRLLTNNIEPVFHNAQPDDIVIPCVPFKAIPDLELIVCIFCSVMGPTGVGKSSVCISSHVQLLVAQLTVALVH
jgi:hypothetical protein